MLKWEPIKDANEYIIFRDNTELKKINKPTYKDKVQGGKSYAYNVTAVDNGGQKGTRSLTEYGKAYCNLQLISKQLQIRTLYLSNGVQ